MDDALVMPIQNANAQPISVRNRLWRRAVRLLLMFEKQVYTRLEVNIFLIK